MKLRFNLTVTAVSAALTFLIGSALVGCSEYTTVEPETASATTSQPETSTPSAVEYNPETDAAALRKLWERNHVLQDGTEVTCLSMGTSALSCDWEGARRVQP